MKQDNLATRDDDSVTIPRADWWKFAPWQGMETAPMCEDILVTKNNGKVFSIYLVADFERDNYKKWLPLPAGVL